MMKYFWLLLYRINLFIMNKFVPKKHIYFMVNGVKYDPDCTEWKLIDGDVVGMLQEKDDRE